MEIKEGTPLFRLCGKTHIKANSFHHQAIKRLGEGLEVMATACDGIIEGCIIRATNTYARINGIPKGFMAPMNLTEMFLVIL